MVVKEVKEILLQSGHYVVSRVKITFLNPKLIKLRVRKFVPAKESCFISNSIQENLKVFLKQDAPTICLQLMVANSNVRH